MRNAGRGQPSVANSTEAIPGHPVALASTPKRLSPESSHLFTKSRHRVDVTRNGVVAEVSPQHTRQPPPLFRNGLVTTTPKFDSYLLQLHSQSFLDSDAPEPETPVLGLSTDVGKSQEVEGLRLFEAPLLSVLSRKATELDQAGLVRVQF